MAHDDDKVVGFSPSDGDRLVSLITTGETPVQAPQRRVSHPLIHCKTQGGGIPARATLTMGSASCDRYDCSSAGVLSDSGDDVTVYNMASSAVAATTHIIAAYNSAGLLVCVVEDCG